MRVLVTNDDGVGAAGLEALAASLKKMNHDVWVVAPSKNRSGVSHGISLTEPLEVVETETGGRVFSCSGKPADCVIAALCGLLPAVPDVVLSGINLGANLGTDVVFSGTAAAARQAAIHGVPGIAVSLVVENAGGADDAVAESRPENVAENAFPGGNEPLSWGPLADFVSYNVRALMKLCREDVFVNINALNSGGYRGFKMTTLCRRIYHDTMRFFSSGRRWENSGRADCAGRRPGGSAPVECVSAGGYIRTVSAPCDDWDAVRDGFISVSAVSAQPSAIALDGAELVLPAPSVLRGDARAGEEA